MKRPDSSGTDISVLLVGPYPPPLGGVSVHVQRLTRTLATQGIDVAVVNHYGRRSDGPIIDVLHGRAFNYWRVLRRASAPIVHYHHGGRVLTLLAAALARPRARGGFWIVTLHGHDLQPFLRTRVRPAAAAARWALRRFDHIVAVSPEIAAWAQEHVPGASIAVVPAYITPIAQDVGPVDVGVGALVKQANPLLAASAYGVVRASGGGDLYGLDVASNVFVALADQYPRLALALYLAKPPQSPWARRFFRREVIGRVLAQGLGDRLIIRVGANILPVLAPGVIYLRPTRRDGDAVSVREALDCGAIVIASGVTSRPEGTHVVDGADVDRWCTAVSSVLSGHQPAPCPPRHDRRGPDPTARQLLDLYAPHLEGSRAEH